MNKILADLNARIADLMIMLEHDPEDRKAAILLDLATKDKINLGEKLFESVASQQSGHDTVEDRLKQLGVQYSCGDVDYLFNHEINNYAFLKSPGLTKQEAQSIINDIKFKVKSKTRRRLASAHSIHIGRLIEITQGQGTSDLYYGYTGFGCVVAVKVFSDEHIDEFDRQVRANTLFQHGNISKFIDSFTDFDDYNKFSRHFIVMPFYPQSVADFISSCSQIPVSVIKRIARDCFSALCHVHSNGYIFVDLKPSNIMLSNTDEVTATLIDLGAVVKIGEPVVEYSQEYCLDVNTAIATEKIDWACFGTTIANMSGVDIFLYNSRSLLIDACERRDMNDDIRRLIKTCFKPPYLKDIQAIIEQLE